MNYQQNAQEPTMAARPSEGRSRSRLRQNASFRVARPQTAAGIERRVPLRHTASFRVARPQISLGTERRAPPRTKSESHANNKPTLVAMLFSNPNPTTAYQGHMFQQELNDYRISDEDLVMLTNNDQAFRAVKKSLKGMGCVTNGYLQQSLHFYVKHTKEVNERLAASAKHRGIQSPTSKRDNAMAA